MLRPRTCEIFNLKFRILQHAIAEIVGGWGGGGVATYATLFFCTLVYC